MGVAGELRVQPLDDAVDGEVLGLPDGGDVLVVAWGSADVHLPLVCP